VKLTTELIPARIAGSRQLLIVLHGLGDSMEGYRWLPAMLGLPALNILLVNAPDSYYGGYSWYAYPGDAVPGVVRSQKLLTELLAEQKAAGFPPEQTFLFGFSQGCLMTLETGLRHQDRLAGLIGISGYVLDVPSLLRESTEAGRGQKILWTHGRHDPLIPFLEVERQMEAIRAAGVAVEWHAFNKEHTIAGEAELAVIRRFIENNLRDSVSPAVGMGS
jgi:phospholipase/carboxylesterase